MWPALLGRIGFVNHRRNVRHIHDLVGQAPNHTNLKEHIADVIALLRLSEDWKGFFRALDRAFSNFGKTTEMPLTGRGPKAR